MGRTKINDYLREAGLAAEGYDLEAGVGVYLWEMERKLKDPRELREMMPTFLAPRRDIPRERPVIVIDAGGTNLRVAVATLRAGGGTAIGDYRVHAMPGSRSRVGRDEFFDVIARSLAGVIDKSDDIGFCFSYPLVMTSCREGRLLQLSKQLDIEGMVDRDVVSGLVEALARNRMPADKRVAILNDSAAVLASGLTLADASCFGSFIGFILGTGINIAYVEANRNIAKLGAGAGSDEMIVNMEASRFSMFPQGRVDAEMDREMTDPGDYLFEKMVSGKYLGRLFHTLLLHACRHGIFSPAFAEKIAGLDGIATEELGELFASFRSGRLAGLCAEASRADAEAFHLLADAVVDRAARYAAIALCAVMRKCGQGRDPRSPVCIVAEGGAYRHFHSLRERIGQYIWSYFQRRDRVHYRITTVENAALVGAAAAALCASTPSEGIDS